MAKYLVDIGLLITFLFSFISGIIKFPGLRPLQADFLIPMNWISLIHDWSGIILGILVFSHILLSWNWMTTMTRYYLRSTRK